MKKEEKEEEEFKKTSNSGWKVQLRCARFLGQPKTESLIALSRSVRYVLFLIKMLNPAKLLLIALILFGVVQNLFGF